MTNTATYGLPACTHCVAVDARLDSLAARVEALESTVRKEHQPALDEHEDRLDEHERRHEVAEKLLEARYQQLTNDLHRNHEILLAVRGQNSEILALLLRDTQ